MTPVPSVSVIIPTRNRCALLGRSLECVRQQRDVDVEAIVVDDASEDGTAEFLARVSDLNLVVIRHERSLGVAAARNAGLTRASNSWVAFLDDDDLWAPGKLAAQVDRMQSGTARCWSVTGAAMLNSDLQILELQPPPDENELARTLLAYNVIPGGGSAVMARTELVRELGGFDPALRIVADWDLWIRLALAEQVAAVESPLAAYVWHQRNMTRDLSTMRSELHYVTHKYEAERARLGVDVALDNWLDWMADTQRRAGRRLEPAGLWLRLAARKRSPRLVGRAVLAAAWPGWVHVRDTQRTKGLPADRIEPVEHWLAPIRLKSSRGTVEQEVA